METTALLSDLEPVVADNLDRHLRIAKEWMPHDYVPWSSARDYADAPWEPGQSPLVPAARTAIEVNLWTEDNLPSYHHEIATRFGRDGAWGTWVHRWTAEEGRHAFAIRDYLLVTRAVDPVALERGRMQVMETGYDSGGKTALQALAYTSFQELATRVSHRNTGRLSGDPVADRLLARVAADENLHMVFYRDLVRAALELDPDATLAAIADEVVGFAMPGTGIAGFERKAALIANAGIYDLRVHHDDVLLPCLTFWGVSELTGLGPVGEQARERIAGHVAEVDRLATKLEERRAARAARVAAAA